LISYDTSDVLKRIPKKDDILLWISEFNDTNKAEMIIEDIKQTNRSFGKSI